MAAPLANPKLPADELRRRHAAREKARRVANPSAKKKREGERLKRRRAEKAPESHARTGPNAVDWIEARARVRRPFEARAKLPAGMMLDDGVGRYSGHGVLVGPEDFEKWLTWSRACSEPVKRKARAA